MKIAKEMAKNVIKVLTENSTARKLEINIPSGN